MIISNVNFPIQLSEINNSPEFIYAYGNIELLYSKKIIAIVGSRHPSKYGIEMARKFSCELAKEGFIIISGFAIGIDTQAHISAIKASGKTIAVLGCGIDTNYPKSNELLKEEIIKNHLVITEYKPSIKPKGIYYPYRNRIISGLSVGVLVIESKIKSGTFTTVNHALNQGKTIFAIPGNIDNPMSEGTNYLIQLGATSALNVADIINNY